MSGRDETMQVPAKSSPEKDSRIAPSSHRTLSSITPPPPISEVLRDVYDEEVDVLVESLISLLEPIMIVVLGLIVGTIVIALFMPLLGLLEGLSGGKK